MADNLFAMEVDPEDALKELRESLKVPFPKTACPNGQMCWKSSVFSELSGNTRAETRTKGPGLFVLEDFEKQGATLLHLKTSSCGQMLDAKALRETQIGVDFPIFFGPFLALVQQWALRLDSLGLSGSPAVAKKF